MNNTKIRTIRAITISTAVALGFGTGAASAGPSATQFVSDGANSYVVRFPDLDLSKIDGAAALYGRLSRAAHVVCEPLQSRDLAIAARYRACLVQAVANAVAQVDRPMLSQYYESRTKGDKASFVQLAQAN